MFWKKKKHNPLHQLSVYKQLYPNRSPLEGIWPFVRFILVNPGMWVAIGLPLFLYSVTGMFWIHFIFVLPIWVSIFLISAGR